MAFIEAFANNLLTDFPKNIFIRNIGKNSNKKSELI